MVSCKYCDREYEKPLSIFSHERFCKNNPNRQSGRVWTAADRENQSKIMKEVAKTCKKKIWTEEERKIQSEKSKLINLNYWTPENRKLQSERMKLLVSKSPDSYSINNVSGRVKMIEYNGSTFKGNWERDVAIYLDKHNINWTNKTNPIKYFWEENNSYHSYFPDFYLPDLDLYIEVKGYERERDRCKWKVLDNLLVLKKIDIKQIQNDEFDIKKIAG